MLAAVLLLVCCCCVFLFAGGAAFAYWYFYHYLAPAPQPVPQPATPTPVTTPPPSIPPTPPTTPTPPKTPTTPPPKTPPTTPTPPKTQTTPPPTTPTPPYNGIKFDPKFQYTSGTFEQLKTIVDERVINDIDGIKWNDHHHAPLNRYDMVMDGNKIVGIVVTDAHPDTLRYVPNKVRQYLDAITFLYTQLKRDGDRTLWTTENQSVLGGYWGSNGSNPYLVIALRAPVGDEVPQGRAGQNIIINSGMDPNHPNNILVLFHELGHVFTGSMLKNHKGWDGKAGDAPCTECGGDVKEPLCSYCKNLAAKEAAFTAAKFYTCETYKYECRPSYPLEYLAAVFYTYFCMGSPQKQIDPMGWDFANSMFHQKAFPSLQCREV